MADFIKLYIILIFIPVAAILVQAAITWARDMDATARRMRQVDEQSKIVAFWNNWMKAATTLELHSEERNEKTEFLIRSLVVSARDELADAGNVVFSIYKWDDYRALQKYKLDFAGFQKFRAGLPWYRRAFLLYSAPNFEVKIPKLAFHLMLVPVVFLLITLPVHGITAFGHSFATSIPLQGIDTFWSAHQMFFAVFSLVNLVSLPLLTRQLAIWHENDRSLYIRDRIKARYCSSKVDGDPKADT